MKSTTLVSRGNKPGTLVRCPNPLCEGKTWRYKGNMKNYIICPDCRNSLKLREVVIPEPESEE